MVFQTHWPTSVARWSLLPAVNPACPAVAAPDSGQSGSRFRHYQGPEVVTGAGSVTT